MTNRCPRIRALLRRGEEQKGAIAIYMALVLMVLMIVAAFAIDISRWYVELQRLQRAADAGALAAAPLMPASVTGNPTGKAYSEAVSTVGRNGFPASGVTAYNVPGSATKVKVTVQSTVTNSFASLFGFTSTTLHRSATADFAGPVAIGSPCNLFGREDMETNQWGSAACSTAGEYWANISGERVNKARGDAFAPTWCTKPDTVSGPTPLIDGCSETNDSGTSPGVNLDHTDTGYVFKVRAKRTGALHLQGYDMGWVATGDNCDDGNSKLVGVNVTNHYVTDATEASRRYHKGASNYCTGDSQAGLPEGDNSTVVTKITVRDPSVDPYRPLEGPIRCTHTIPGWPISTPLSALSAAGSNNELARTFHRWAELVPGCTIPAVAGKDYSIQIQTSGGGGQNRFALRAAYNGVRDSANSDVSIFAVDRISLYNNVSAGTSKFNLVRLDSSTANHTLSVRFFDLGDANDGVTATVLQPDSDTPYTNCTGIGPKPNWSTVGPPENPQPLPGCSVVATVSGNGGRWQTVKIPIAEGYRCPADDDQSKCWVRIRLETTAYQADTTTWTANLEGDPVRLVE